MQRETEREERGGGVGEGWGKRGGAAEDKRGGWNRRMRFFKTYFS